MAAQPTAFTPTVVIHGGAWRIPDEIAAASVDGVRRAAEAAMAVLNGPGPNNTAVDAVEAAVRVLEDDPVFNAGCGSCLTIDGTVEMDAMIMRGDTLATGAVAAVSCVKNPISCARRVMERTSHCLLVGAGADAFARGQGLPLATAADLITESRRLYLDQVGNKGFNALVRDMLQPAKAVGEIGAAAQPTHDHDTVGAVVLDRHGLLACGTSTGGITAKMVGRVGDSPMVGSGGYADNELGAASTTGHGESILKVNLAKRALDVAERLRRECPGKPGGMQRAVDDALTQMQKRVNGLGGLIAIGPDGDVGIGFTTERMPWAIGKGDAEHIECGIEPHSHKV